MYREALAADPCSAEALAGLGRMMSKLNRAAEAEQLFRRALACDPKLPEVRFWLGNLVYRSDPAEAERLYCEAVDQQPSLAWAWCNLGTLLGRRGALAAEQRCYREALQHQPMLAAAHSNLGRTLRRQRRWAEAEACYLRALELQPGLAETHYELGELKLATGRTEQAEASFRQALALKPVLVEVQGRLGALLERTGRLDEAENCYRSLADARPGRVAPLHSLANVLLRQGRPEQAARYFTEVLRLKPDSAYALTDLGVAMSALGAMREEEQCYRQAIALDPNLAAAHSNLGNALKQQGRAEEAEASYRQALLVDSRNVEAMSNLGTLMLEGGRVEEAEQQYRSALEIRPDFHVAYSNLLLCILHSAELDGKALFAEHVRFGERLEGTLPQRSAHANRPDPERRLTVGFVSGDFRKHPVTFFLEPVFRELARGGRVELHAFSNNETEDEVTERIRGYFAGWHRVWKMGDAQLDATVRALGVDVLIDLSGHMAKNRIPLFARKPAPVQMSWFGYMGTSGLKAMDYFIADEVLMPRKVFESQFTEELVYLPVAAPFEPVAGAPEVGPLPALKNGYVTFGSFNRSAKLTERTLQLWARALRAVEASRMAVGNLRSEAEARRVREGLRERGIAPERVQLLPACREQEYLALHRGVDVCLDSAPYTGFTITVQSLWMGVPVVTLAGDTPPARQSASVMTHIGLPEFVAWSEDGYVAAAKAAVADLEKLARLRAGMRERLRGSWYRQPERLTEALEGLLRQVWRRWCERAAQETPHQT